MKRAVRRQWGISTLEFVVVGIVAAVLAWFLMRSLSNVQADAERTVVNINIRQMRTGMQFKITDLIVKGRLDEIATLVGQNPVPWGPQPLEGYLGETDGIPLSLKARSWLFDRRSKQLVYMPASSRLLDPANRRPYLAWRVEAGIGGRDGGIMGVRLTPAR